jgi:hypothetical protein
MTRTFVAMLALLGGCTQQYFCSYRCGTSDVPRGGVSLTGGDGDAVRAQCEKDQTTSCTAEEGPPQCDCNPAEDLSPGTESPRPQLRGVDPHAAGVGAPSRRRVSSSDLLNTRFPASPSRSETRCPFRFFGRRSNWNRTRLPLPTGSAW